MGKNSNRIILAAVLVQGLLLQNFLYAEQLSNPPADAETPQAEHAPADPQANLRLLEAVKSKDPGQIQQALDAGADVNYQFEKGRTALFHAIDKQATLIIDTLLKNGADVNAKDSAGNTPLIHAVKNADFKSVQLLLHYGASTEEQDKSGRNALDLARGIESKEMVGLLKETRDFRSSLGLFVDMRGKDLTLERFRKAAIKAFETRNWQNIEANGNSVSGIYENNNQVFKSTMIYEPDLVIIKFDQAMGFRKPYYLENLRTVFFIELENQ